MSFVSRFLAAFVMAMGAFSNAYSETAVCTGSVKFVAQHVPGWVVVAVGNSTSIFLCNLDNTNFLVTPQACKGFFALALAGQAQNKYATFYIDNAPTTNCADVPFFHNANTRYFEVR